MTSVAPKGQTSFFLTPLYSFSYFDAFILKLVSEIGDVEVRPPSLFFALLVQHLSWTAD